MVLFQQKAVRRLLPFLFEPAIGMCIDFSVAKTSILAINFFSFLNSQVQFLVDFRINFTFIMHLLGQITKLVPNYTMFSETGPMSSFQIRCKSWSSRNALLMSASLTNSRATIFCFALSYVWNLNLLLPGPRCK
jgi:hypothetical protein